MKASILTCIANHRDGIMLKKLKKECLGDSMNSLKEHTAAKQNFKRYYDELVENERITEDIKGLVTLSSGSGVGAGADDKDEESDNHEASAEVVKGKSKHAPSSTGEEGGEEEDAETEKKSKKDKKDKRDRSAGSTTDDRTEKGSVDTSTNNKRARHEEETTSSRGAKNSASVAANKTSGSASHSDANSSSSALQTGDSQIVGDRYELSKNGEQAWREGTLPQEYLAQNPDNITRLFCGNLKLDVTEESLRELFPGITYIRWQKDKETKLFYGSTFLEMKDSRSAAKAVSLDGTKFMGRPLKIYYCPPRPGVIWPPLAGTAGNSSYKDAAGGGGGAGGGSAGAANRGKNGLDPTAVGRGYSQRAKTDRPAGCKKLYAGNLAYTIDDETIVDFFKACGEMVGLRWLTQKDSGEFRGCGFVEFATPEAAEAAMQLDGAELLGRPIRLDWTN